ncbi:threonylcarbamoyl-AMP synthase [Streptomyces viridiviolaceus]|uniref:L-threonylcarbamoyladenylate synthase n=1 Tax=Streptomyces viridiviolaceus TaxID=68282 RepID=A0ABW2EBC5_9ACTN|nr:L-threonylcarbamoyladenylate synthase [Streptomyces viridiviolaceus]GHB67692.1 threonylcarbamoyl-AMP synthase [Streptomyces viridiviolaceus]
MYLHDCQDTQTRRTGLAYAADMLRAGELVVFPTDTLYAVGADAFNEKAVHALLAAKHRGGDKPASVLVGDPTALDALAAHVPPAGRQLIDAFWPGALSLVVPAAASLTCDLGQTHGTVMVRMPQHPVALELLRKTGPLAQSSANLTGHPPATTAEQACTYFGAAVRVYLDGGTTRNRPSTIVDVTKGDNPVILRDGAVPHDQIAAVLRQQGPASALQGPKN